MITHFGPLEFHNYDTKSHITASNNGHTEIMEGFTSWDERPYITGKWALLFILFGTTTFQRIPIYLLTEITAYFMTQSSQGFDSKCV
ncbi:hypothetical protein OESDEN_06599 [Oesophagostomum dentatum]|uniref:Uncharacterized protein n=1 Tax=Oesophagostomum dentatum TaxID=61180 RepID=A0A0B1TCB8_OESDE|nr:hypothetical protein OESDEN_06599 [Oesophagostomum dentatum]